MLNAVGKTFRWGAHISWPQLQQQRIHKQIFTWILDGSRIVKGKQACIHHCAQILTILKEGGPK